jgi:hypothetical protein
MKKTKVINSLIKEDFENIDINNIKIFNWHSCQENIIYDSSINHYVITSPNFKDRKLNKEIEVDIYLTCSKGHTHPYKMKKLY